MAVRHRRTELCAHSNLEFLECLPCGVLLAARPACLRHWSRPTHVPESDPCQGDMQQGPMQLSPHVYPLPPESQLEDTPVDLEVDRSPHHKHMLMQPQSCPCTPSSSSRPCLPCAHAVRRHRSQALQNLWAAECPVALRVSAEPECQVMGAGIVRTLRHTDRALFPESLLATQA